MLFASSFQPTAAAAVETNITRAKQPNIVWFLTDDQDNLLGGSFPPTSVGGVTPMPKTRSVLADAGATATNFFIHTPICCPSRAELLSGRYFHNIKQHGKGPACMHVDEDKVNNATFASYLADAGYLVGMFGKYLNNVPNYVPRGFDAWMANGGGDYFSPSFSTFNAPGLPDGHWKGTSDNYTTAVVGNVSIAWIKKVVSAQKPFFAYVAPKACHEPFNPAPWYRDHWDPSWPAHEIRPANWNASFASRTDHHGNIATEPLITSEAATVITGVFKNRWRTLMSVDDVIHAVVAETQRLGVLEDTYFFYSSDHGFQLGEFNIPMDKRNVYDWNTRIHLLARGPGIKAGSQWSQPATQVDMAATFLGLAGLPKPPTMDGKSLVPLLVTEPTNALDSTRTHLAQLLGDTGDATRYLAAWRNSVFFEYYYNADNVKCMVGCPPGRYPQSDSWCTDLSDNSACWCPPGKGHSNCYATETNANNFIAVRQFANAAAEGGAGSTTATGETLYAEYEASAGNEDVKFQNVNFHELYSMSTDRWQQNNLWNGTGASARAAYHAKLMTFFQCAGDNCP